MSDKAENRPIATVAVERTFFNLDSDYDYAVPPALADRVRPGVAVEVPFGSGNRLRRGIVLQVFVGINPALKDIARVCDYGTVLDESQIRLARWMKNRYFCTTYECLLQMLPRGFGKIGVAGVRMAELTVSRGEELPRLTPKQQSVADLLLDIGSATVEEIKTLCGVGDGVLKNMEKCGVLRFFKKEKYRNPYADLPAAPKAAEIELSAEQTKAYRTLSAMLDGDGGSALLYGVTGSGKTQVYMRLIDRALQQGKDTIVLVPEIGLTPQVLGLFHQRYGRQVAVLHSGLSVGERNDEYRRADRGEAKIVLGTRSAVFAPLHTLGLIIMDEEQELTYKSERTPRYHARDIARYRAGESGALFVMASATPSIESYAAAKAGKYILCSLEHRFGNAALPQVCTVDMKGELHAGHRSPLSRTLQKQIQSNLDAGKQTILLMNRRGYNTFIACNDCGHVITCPNCSISLTYHSYSNRLMCHYCGYSKPLDNTCPECGSHAVRYSGFGTQRIEDELQALFPAARILRMDADTTAGKFSHQKLFDAFAAHEYDILVGTQMVAKGLDFDDVTLVGVVNADNALYDENYLSHERAFDLITQVVGRSGRRDATGTAVIQTIDPCNPVIDLAARQDYPAFFETEYALRRILTYPPFCDIYGVFFVSEDENAAALAALLNRNLTFVAPVDLSPRLLAELCSQIGPELVPVVSAAAAILQDSTTPHVYLGGEQYLLDWPQLEGKVGSILSLLNDEEEAARLIAPPAERRESVLLGEDIEPQIPGLCIVSDRYLVGGGLWGSVALIGPTRMPFQKLMPLLHAFADHLGEGMSGKRKDTPQMAAPRRTVIYKEDLE